MIHHYSPSFTTIHHYSPLFIIIHLLTIIHHYAPLFATIHHYSPSLTIIHLFNTIHDYSPKHGKIEKQLFSVLLHGEIWLGICMCAWTRTGTEPGIGHSGGMVASFSHNSIANPLQIWPGAARAVRAVRAVRAAWWPVASFYHNSNGNPLRIWPGAARPVCQARPFDPRTKGNAWCLLRNIVWKSELLGSRPEGNYFIKPFFIFWFIKPFPTLGF